MKKQSRDVWFYISWSIFILYAFFFLYPVFNLLKQSIQNSSGDLTFKHFSTFFSNPFYYGTIINSFKVTIVVTLLSILIGTVLAYITNFYKIKGKKYMEMLIIISTMSAPFIGAYSWILLLGRNGVITKFLSNFINVEGFNIYGFFGIVLALTTKLFPLIFLYVQGALKNVDNSLIEAAEGMGYSKIKVLWKIIIPLVAPTILAGSLLVFMRAFSDFGTPMLIGEGYRTFPRLMYTEFISEVAGDVGFASAIAVVAIVITTILFLCQNYLSNKMSFSMTALNPVSSKRISGLKNYIMHFASYFIVFVAILPQLFVIYTSFLKTSGLIFVDGYSYQSYISAFNRMGTSIKNTFLIPGTSVLIIIIISVLIAYVSVRRQNALSLTIDTMSMLPYIIPGAVLGIAMVSTFSKKPFVFSGSYIIMIVALVIRRLPYTVRSSSAILKTIPISVEEASISMGTSKIKTFLKITLPMMAPGIISGAILSWVTLISELSTGIILYTTKTETLTVAIYTQIIRGNYGIAAALSTILTVITVISLIVFKKISPDSDIAI